MKYLFSFSIVVLLLLVISCSKTSFITSRDASVSYSADTLHYDTVFTSTGSVTQSFKIFNLNDQKLRLSAVQLMGGATSAFKMNVDGTAGSNFADIDLEPNDSLYVFVTVTVNPSSANLPFIVQDSILVNYNGNDHFVQLEAYGQNANFLRGRRITSDSTWNNNLPFVILDSLSVDENVMLTIGPGCHVYNHANAPFIVNGSLKVNGDSNARVSFAGDRLDPDYKDLPGSWPGLIFNESSTNNVLNYAIIKNAYQGIVTQGLQAVPYKIELNQCIIDNIYDAGILSANSSIKAINCLISNCGANIYIYAGGKYLFDYCTVASYGNFFLSHQTPVLTVGNADIFGTTSNLEATLRNSIFYGDNGNVDDEIVVLKKDGGNSFTVGFENILYKNKTANLDAFNPTNSKKNETPEFATIDISKGVYDFHLKDISPALNAGTYTNIDLDLDGKPRPSSNIAIGCYQRQ